jgi:hypothetical protein
VNESYRLATEEIDTLILSNKKLEEEVIFLKKNQNKCLCGAMGISEIGKMV